MWGDYTEVRPYKSKNGIKNLPFNHKQTCRERMHLDYDFPNLNNMLSINPCKLNFLVLLT